MTVADVTSAYACAIQNTSIVATSAPRITSAPSSASVESAATVDVAMIWP
jgi:hypothetical protein